MSIKTMVVSALGVLLLADIKSVLVGNDADWVTSEVSVEWMWTSIRDSESPRVDGP